MADRKPVSDPKFAAAGAFRGQIERNANFRQQASNHNLGRNVRVMQLFGYMALMRQGGVALAGNVQCVAASLQDFQSRQSMTQMGLPTGPMQAAHFMPGRIRVGDRDIWQWAGPITRPHIESLFSEVEHLPLPFNQADTEAEAKGAPGGLCFALVQGCTALLRHKAASPARGGKISMEMVRVAFEAWHTSAIAALVGAHTSKSAKPGLPPLVGNPFEGYDPDLIAARSDPKASEWNRDEAVRILELYLEDQRMRMFAAMWETAQSALAGVERNYKS
jgi:hypothetical protein